MSAASRLEMFCRRMKRNYRYPTFIPLQQAYYFINETTQETSWDAPITTPQKRGAGAEAMGAASHGGGGEDTVSQYSTNRKGIAHSTCNHDAMNTSVDRSEEQALAVSSTTDILGTVDAAQPQFPFYVNERGNRVFCIPRGAKS